MMNSAWKATSVLVYIAGSQNLLTGNISTTKTLIVNQEHVDGRTMEFPAVHLERSMTTNALNSQRLHCVTTMNHALQVIAFKIIVRLVRYIEDEILF